MLPSFPDFVITGQTETLDRWAAHAMRTEALWCHEYDRGTDHQCEKCLKPGFCGILSPEGMLKVIPVQAAPNFPQSNEHDILLITPSKTANISSVAEVRRFLTTFASLFEPDAALFESRISSTKVVEWIRLH